MTSEGGQGTTADGAPRPVTHEESGAGEPRPPGHPERLLGRVFGGQYRIEQHVGSGGFGDVFRAVQEKTGQLVALKVLRPRQGKSAPSMDRQLARFRREMRACAELHHPHVVRLIDSGETDDGLLFSVFEYVPGQTLADLLREKGALPVETAIELMSQVLDALGAAHRQGIVHRDLKPNNIMASTSGLRPQVTVLDFGISAFLEGMVVDDFQSLTMTREILGTPAYAAPEQLRGETPSSKSDLYAWGLVFAECLLGRAVFDGPTAMEIAHRQLSSEPVVLPERLQRDRLGTLLRWVLEKDVTRRAGDAALVMSRLLEKRSLGDLVDANGYFVETEPDPRARAAPAPVDASLAASAGERRQVTAVCCVIGIGETGAEAPPEELDRALQETQALCMRVASRFGVEVAGGFGGQVLLYFGFPRASDTDARRAAIAALEIAHEVRRQNERSAVRVELRIGIHTGLVTTTPGFERGPASAIFGVTPGEAGRLAQDAPPSGIAVSAASVRHLGPSFEFRIGASPSGKAIHQLVAESRAESAAAASTRVPFVGRAAEVEALRAAWRAARAGRGQTVLIVGEPGMGKSRLARELRQDLEGVGSRWLTARCLPELQPSALGPVSELLVEELDLAHAGEDGDAGARRLEATLSDLGLGRPEAMALLGPWLGLGPVAPLALSPQKQKAMLLELLVDLLLALAERQSAPFLVEDLHWADPTTRELVELLARKVPATRGLVILTARPDAGLQLPPELVRVVRLQHLERADVERIVRELVGREFLSRGLLSSVVDRAEGNPFFVEEVTRYIVDSSAQATMGGQLEDAPSPGVPTKLRDILAGRLDRLGRAKETAQLAAAIGREFDYRLLASLRRENEASLLTDLEQMVSAELLIRRRHVDNPLYMFRHALIRDAAYESLPSPARRAIHRQIAGAMEAALPEHGGHRPELVAHHYSRAGAPALAVPLWQRAGQNSIAKFAHVEAIAHFGSAIEQQLALPPSRDRSRKEIELRTEVGLALMTTKGYSAKEVEDTYRRAAELCEELGDELPLRVLYGIWVVNLVRADPGPVARLVERFRAIEKNTGKNAGDEKTQLIIRALIQAGVFWYPDYAGSLRSGDEARTLFDAADPKSQHETLLRDHGFEGLFYPHIYGAWGRVITGSPSIGRALWSEAFAIAQNVGDPYALATIRSFGVIIDLMLGDLPAARRLADELLATTVENSFLLWKAFALVPRGRMMVAEGDVENGLKDIQEGLGILQAIGAMISFPIYQALFIEALLEIGRDDEAEAVCAEALAMMAAKKFLAWEPVIHRLRGELLRKKGDPGGAEAALRHSIALCREQGAAIFELAAACSLAELLHAQGRAGEARGPLADVLTRLEPDSREPIVRRARDLLAQLSP
jgi:TOMM system kinase/cyclase fusion protein